MISGKVGSGIYKENGEVKYTAYSPVKGTNGVLSVTMSKSEIISELYKLLKTMIIVFLSFAVAGIIVVILISVNISKPLRKASEYIQRMAEGDFTQVMPEKILKRSDEIGILAGAVDK